MQKDIHADFKNKKKYYMLECEKIFKITRKITKSTTRLLRELKTALSKYAARFWSRCSFQGVEPVSTGGTFQVKFMFFQWFWFRGWFLGPEPALTEG